MRNVSFHELQAIVDFMYFGEVNIEQENLSSFLAVTEELQIHGLSGNINQETKKEGSRKRDKPCSDSFQSSPMKKMRSPSRRLSSPPPPPPPSTTTSSSSIRKPFLSSLNQQDVDTGILHVEDLKQEVILEPDSIATDPGRMLETHNSDLHLAHQEYQVADESDIYGEDGYDYDMDMDGSNQGLEGGLEGTYGDVPYHSLIQTEDGFICKLCGKTFTKSQNARRHLRNAHVSQPMTCSFCNKTLKNERTYKMHVSLNHTDKQ
ncbi:zinc finger and BTB domain-containing protein 26 isoform X2 [Eurytemora carolleeae]|uniref:zinc finger and BTB domain-containing protein 26 isoform X2 n=1 Tax=Eurytemora carolleeae TaxID=1294199 RepID=UPI000C784DFC|nr:zinc finger and BTB domain-containing protein 26 isoform X2 [Eurytemora carolleeae]|eukprot:XP_023348652.1 zinc finger and BTB domain-containing protein 26-like isoform X2 [Eurytemora affinis]